MGQLCLRLQRPVAPRNASRLVCTRTTAADACDEWLWCTEYDRQRRASTLRDYRSVVRNHIVAAFERMPDEDLTTEHRKEWMRTLSQDKPVSGRQNPNAEAIVPTAGRR